MSFSNVPNQVPYLRTSRTFPEEPDMLKVEVEKAYLDIANVVNARTIGVFTVNKPTVTGESFLLNSGKKQSLRQVYTFGAGVTSLNHNINNFSSIPYFSAMYGQYTDGTNWYGLIAGSNTAISGQLSFYLTPTQITILNGGGSPTLSNAIVVLEWLSNI